MAMEPHSHEHVHDEAHTHAHDEMSAVSARARYAPVQLTSLGVGVFLIAIGAIGLARMGFDGGDLRDRSTQVLGIGMSPMLAFIYLGAGIIAVVCAAGRELSRGAMLILGPVMTAAGIALLVRPETMVLAMRPEFSANWDAMVKITAVAYLVAGGIGLAAVIGTPITWFGRRSYEGRRHAPAM